MQKNIVRNSNIDFIGKKVFIPASAFVQSQVTGASVILDAGFGTGAAQLLELGTSAHGAIRLEATTDDVRSLLQVRRESTQVPPSTTAASGPLQVGASQ